MPACEGEQQNCAQEAKAFRNYQPWNHATPVEAAKEVSSIVLIIVSQNSTAYVTTQLLPVVERLVGIGYFFFFAP
jgi:hypothetical protein